MPKSARLPRRFSLATLMLLATIACLGVALWSTWQGLKDARAQVKKLEEEVEKYRKEVGYLSISEPGKAHATGVRAPGKLQWRWRVYVPDDRRFRLHRVTGRVPQEGVPAPGTSSGSSSTIPSGESLLHAEVKKSRRGQWVLRVEEGDGRGSITRIQQTDTQWLDESSGWTIEQVRPGEPKVFEPGEPIVLLRLRVHEMVETTDDGRTSRRAPDEPCDGLIIWIGEAE